MDTAWLQVYWLFTLMISWLIGSWGSLFCHDPASRESIILHIPSPEKIKIQSMTSTECI